MISKATDIDIYDEDYNGLVSICITDTEPPKVEGSQRTPRTVKSPSIDTVWSFDGATIEDYAPKSKNSTKMISKATDIDIYDEDYNGLVSVCITDTEPIEVKSSPRTPRRVKSPSIDTLFSFDGGTIEDDAPNISVHKNSKLSSLSTPNNQTLSSVSTSNQIKSSLSSPTNQSYNTKSRQKPTQLFIIQV